ncbi:hypothetical protein, partial [Celeribacter halophilus]|uniref:hypothetical protein n=1 Tax=Celeribacter halophilus TaxID=576117 RepID=UPI003A91D461
IGLQHQPYSGLTGDTSDSERDDFTWVAEALQGRQIDWNVHEANYLYQTQSTTWQYHRDNHIFRARTHTQRSFF